MPRLRTTLTAAAALAACGGGGDDGNAAGAGGGTLTLSATTPAAQATTIDLSTATAKGTSGRLADGFSSVPYREIFWENANGANGRKYAVQVYFRQGDKLPMHVSVVETGGWGVFHSSSGAAITGITVDTTARTAVFNHKVLAGAAGEAGTVSFGSSTTAACGARSAGRSSACLQACGQSLRQPWIACRRPMRGLSAGRTSSAAPVPT